MSSRARQPALSIAGEEVQQVFQSELFTVIDADNAGSPAIG